MSSSLRRLKRTRVSTRRWRNASLRRHQADRGVDAVVAARQQPQALRGLVDQIGLRQDAAADRDHGVGGENEGAAQFVVELHRFERGIGLGAGQPVGAGARQLAPLRGLVDIGRTQRIGLDAGLIEQADSRRGEPEARTNLGRPSMRMFDREIRRGLERARNLSEGARHSTTRRGTCEGGRLTRLHEAAADRHDPDRHRERLHGTSGSPARRADLGKALADAQQQAVADLAIGLQLLLAVALGAGRIAASASIRRRRRACASVPAPCDAPPATA